MEMKSTKRALFATALALLMCVTMLIGTTFAWFTDSVTSANNIIKSGNLDVELYYSVLDNSGNWTNYAKVDTNTKIFNSDRWEPGYTEVARFKIVNEGSLALKYQLTADVLTETVGKTKDNANIKLSEHLKYGVTEDLSKLNNRTDAAALAVNGFTSFEVKSAELTCDQGNKETEVGMVIAMPTTVGNEANHNGVAIPEIQFGITLVATQATVESDSFNNLYDEDATYPIIVSAKHESNNDTVLEVENFGSVTVPDEAPEGNYEVSVVPVAPVTVNNETTLNFDLSLLKDGVPVTPIANVKYPATVNVGKNLLLTEVLHKGNPITNYTYDSVSGILTFETDSFSPFSISYVVIPEGSTMQTTDPNGKITFYETFVDAAKNVASGTTITPMDNVTLTKTLVIDKDIVLDLGGKTISGQLGTLIKITDGSVVIKNGTIKNVHAAATETKYSIFMTGDAVATIENVDIETSGTGIYLAGNSKITNLNANVLSYMTANGSCCYDAVSLYDNARIDAITGGKYESRYTDAYIDFWNQTHSYSGIASYTINLNGEGTSIGNISGGTFLGVMDKGNNGNAIHVNNGTVELISGGYFGFSDISLTQPDVLLYVNSGNNASIKKITGGTYVKGDWKGFGCDFDSIVNASGCAVEETGETVEIKAQFSTRLATYTLKVVKVVAK